ncbi:ORF6N domain-containing protein [Cronobacter dublinensis]|uniref:ORF6N domain-containing protein n=1 Tax=Cronobacter dublinensis TaxID=413497 RepID=UPI00300DD49B
MKNQITAETLSPITHKQRPVITTEILAQLYGTDVKNIQNNYARNTARFVAGKHFYKLVGDELRHMKHRLSLSEPVKKHRPSSCGSVKIARNVRSLILWTERGAARHAKMLETDQAWEVFEKLEDSYFKTPNTATPAPTVTGQQKILITLENGVPVSSRPLLPGEVTATPELFSEMLKKIGYVVVQREVLAQMNASQIAKLCGA